MIPSVLPRVFRGLLPTPAPLAAADPHAGLPAPEFVPAFAFDPTGNFDHQCNGCQRDPFADENGNVLARCSVCRLNFCHDCYNRTPKGAVCVTGCAR